MTMRKVLHPRDDIDRLYVSRKEGGKGLASTEDSIEDSVDASIQQLGDYMKKRGGRLITATRNNRQQKHQQNNNNLKTKIERKHLYGHFKR